MPPPKLPLMQSLVNRSALIAEKMGFVCFLHLGCCGPPCGPALQPGGGGGGNGGARRRTPPPPRRNGVEAVRARIDAFAARLPPLQLIQFKQS